MRLSRVEHQQLKAKAKTQDYTATVALLDLMIQKSLEDFVASRTNHDYLQGKVHALRALRDEVVSKQQ